MKTDREGGERFLEKTMALVLERLRANPDDLTHAATAQYPTRQLQYQTVGQWVDTDQCRQCRVSERSCSFAGIHSQQ